MSCPVPELQLHRFRPAFTLAALPDLGSIARGTAHAGKHDQCHQVVSRGSLGSWLLFSL